MAIFELLDYIVNEVSLNIVVHVHGLESCALTCFIFSLRQNSPGYLARNSKTLLTNGKEYF